MRNIGGRWQAFGAGLGYEMNFLEAITGDPMHCMNVVFAEWFRNGKNVTWKGLIDALEVAELDNLATEVRGALPTMIK